MELIATEAQVGPFRLDIRAQDVNIKSEIIIENQFGHTDHSHLGQLLTYASGFDAGVVVWIAENFRDEHRDALNFLNNRTDEDTQFFGVEIELWKIGESLVAPHFNLVSTPNEWRKQGANRTQQASGYVSERQERYRVFFQKLIDTMREQHKFTEARVGRAQSWYRFASGFSGITYGANFTHERIARVQLYIGRNDKGWNEDLFDWLSEQKVSLEAALDDTLLWQRLDNRIACRISVTCPASIYDGDEALVKTEEWMVERLLKFKAVFEPRLEELVD